MAHINSASINYNHYSKFTIDALCILPQQATTPRISRMRSQPTFNIWLIHPLITGRLITKIWRLMHIISWKIWASRTDNMPSMYFERSIIELRKSIKITELHIGDSMVILMDSCPFKSLYQGASILVYIYQWGIYNWFWISSITMIKKLLILKNSALLIRTRAKIFSSKSKNRNKSNKNKKTSYINKF